MDWGLKTIDRFFLFHSEATLNKFIESGWEFYGRRIVDLVLMVVITPYFQTQPQNPINAIKIKTLPHPTPVPAAFWPCYSSWHKWLLWSGWRVLPDPGRI